MNANPSTSKARNNGATPPAAGRVKIDELAEHLGLSKSTVSRALNGYSDIAETTRKRVENAARKLGYRPLSHAQAIRTGRVRAIAMVLNSEEPDGHNPFLQEFLAGACEAASGFDWTMTISMTCLISSPPPKGNKQVTTANVSLENSTNSVFHLSPLESASQWTQSTPTKTRRRCQHKSNTSSKKTTGTSTQTFRHFPER